MWAALVERFGPQSHDELLAIIEKPWAPLRSTWGTDTAAVEGQRAMMALAGGPAPMRDPNKPRPTPARG